MNQQIQELNGQFKKNVKLLTEIKDSIQRVCEKQESRLSDDDSSINKMEQVSPRHRETSEGTPFAFIFVFNVQRNEKKVHR